MSPRPSSLLAAAAICLLLGCNSPALAQQSASNPSPKLDSDFLITPSPILTPWQNGGSASEGSTDALAASVARLTFGACVYRAAHWHSVAWEVLTPVTPGLSLTTVMQEPSNFGSGASRTDVVAPGQSISFPAGWTHLQLNDNCSPLDAVLVWNAVNSGGTTNLAQASYSFDPAWGQVGFVTPLPAPAATNWVVDPTCAARCGITTASSVSAKTAFKDSLQQTAGLAFSGEQVAAADATALFGQGLKATLQKDAQLGVAAVKQAKNATRAAVGAVVG